MSCSVRISDCSKTTTLGNWSADILVRSRRSVNPEADRNVRMGAGQNSPRAISNQGRAEVQGGRRDMWETPRASFIPAQGNALGSSAPNPISAESAIHPSSYQPGEHLLHRNPFFIGVIREIRGSNCCNPWFQLLFLALIPMKSQASTNSVLRPCPRSEKSKMRTHAECASQIGHCFR